MIRRIIKTVGAAVLLTACLGAISANAAPVNRPLADELTRQYNQQELRQMESIDAGAYAQPRRYRVITQPPYQPGTALQPGGISPAGVPPRPEWSPLPR